MASLQAHFLDLTLRVTVKSRLKGAMDLADVRKTLEGGKLPIPKGVTFTPATVGGIAGEWVRAGDGGARPILLYLHGGGYFACSPRTHRPITGAYAQRGFDVFAPEYRLAPEHPYPAAIEDAEAAWHGLIAAGTAAERLTISGDSAGGGLTLALLLTLRDKGEKLPAAAALFSPWTDLAGTGASIISNARWDAMFHAAGLKGVTALYLGTRPAELPLASPLYAELGGLPPLLIHVGDREMLRDDSTRLAERASAAGVTVTLKRWPVVPHVWQLAQFVPEAKRSMDEAAEFLKGSVLF
jgi:acetyl esterase/lipase